MRFGIKHFVLNEQPPLLADCNRLSLLLCKKKYEPAHEILVLIVMSAVKAQMSLRICAVSSEPLLYKTYLTYCPLTNLYMSYKS